MNQLGYVWLCDCFTNFVAKYSKKIPYGSKKSIIGYEYLQQQLLLVVWLEK